MLDEELREDKEGRERFKERWTRTPSADLQKSIREKLERFQRLMGTAKGSDEIVRKKFEANLHYIESLCATKV